MIEADVTTTSVAPIKQFLSSNYNLTEFLTGDSDGIDDTLVGHRCDVDKHVCSYLCCTPSTPSTSRRVRPA